MKRCLLRVSFALPLLVAGSAYADGPVPEPLAPPPAVEVEPCQALNHPNGRLASIVCGPTQEPLRNGNYRFQHFTGTQTTYYEHGGVHEVLPLNDGLLDGLVELYDPVGHLLERVIFRGGQKQESGVAPLSPPPLPSPENVVPQLSPEEREHRPIKDSTEGDDETGIGLGLLGTATVGKNARGTFLQLGPSLDFLFRLSGKFAVELRAEFAHSVTNLSDYRRIDVPLLIGFRYAVLGNRTRLYLIGGMGADYAWRKIPGDIVAQPSESAWMFDVQAGFGVGGRISRHAMWLGELRIGGLVRNDDKTPLQAPDVNGMPVEQLGNQFTTQLSVGVMWMP